MKRSADENQDSFLESVTKKKQKVVKELLHNFTCYDFYIDKSLLIKKFLEESSKIICITIPYECGKTVNLLMMKYFFEMNYNDEKKLNNREFFENLSIAKEAEDGEKYIDLYQGKFPVIYLDCDEIVIGSSYEKTIENFDNFIKELYNVHQDIGIESLKYEKDKWINFQKNKIINESDLKESISFLCKCLNKLLGSKIILLVDNYDSPFIKASHTNFYGTFYSFYEQVLNNIFNDDKKYKYLFKTFITGKFSISFFWKFSSKHYFGVNNEYGKYFSITNFELNKLLSKLHLENNVNNISSISVNNVTNINDKNEINIIFSSSLNKFNDNDKSYNNNNNNNNNNKYDDKIKFYDLVYVKNYIQDILSLNKANRIFPLEDKTLIKEAFKYFDFIIFKDMNYLLKNGTIEKSISKLTDFKSDIENNRDMIWTLFIEYGYLVIDQTYNKNNTMSNYRKLKIRNEEIKEFIKINFFEWKNNLQKKYKNIINLFIKNYDEEKIKESLEDLINNNCKYQYSFLEKYYALIYSLLSLDDQYEVITKNNINEKEDIRELLFVNKKLLNSNFDFNNISNNSNNYNNNEIKKGISSHSLSNILYITIKDASNMKNIEEGCIEALDYNENFEFNGKNLKKVYNKIIKFGIAFSNYECDVLYEINYGDNFKRREMPKNIYSGENYKRFNTNKFFFIDKTKMISKLIEKEDDVFLITRPRRFGKSLNLSMIEEFFEKPINGNNDGIDLFDGLEISKNRKNMRHFHKYPVIHLNFKDHTSENYDSAIIFLKWKISKLFEYHRKRINFEKLGKNQQKLWMEIENQSENIETLKGSLLFLSECLKVFYKRNCIILIDEYDKILINSFENNFYKSIYNIITSLYSSAYKRNTCMYFGIATGCLNIGFNSLFSGFNNFHECSFYCDPLFSDCYGFTEKELNNILSFFGYSEDNKEIIKNKYNGYSCGFVNNKNIIKI